MLKYGILREKDLPNPLVINEKLMTHEDYIERLNKQARSHGGPSRVKALLTGKVLYDGFKNLFYIQHEVKHLFTSQPSFSKYTEVDEVYMKLIRMKMPDNEWWTNLIDLIL